MTSSVIVSTQQLTKQFDDLAAVDQVSLSIETGEVYGLIGPNGAGKTTLIRMLAAAEEPTVGDIFIQGQRLMRGDANPEIQRQIGFLPDDFPLYDDLTVTDYLDYFARLYFLREPQLGDRIETVLNLVSLTGKRNSLIGGLSRGMRQRLSLARCIIHQPTLLLLDEPVSGLDPIARIEMRNVIKQLQAEGVTILISSHVLSDLEDFCTSVGVMEKGRLVESARLQALYERSNVQNIIVGTTGELADLEAALTSYDGVQACKKLAVGSRIGIEFSGSEDEIAALLRSLITSGLPIVDFSRTRESLESIFLKMGYQETS
ncbi:MAG: ABC transporter ATP-binding protein [Elainellaceae cyanobacterium]